MDSTDHELNKGSSENTEENLDISHKEPDSITHPQSSDWSSSSASSLNLDAIETVSNSPPLESEKADLDMQGPTPVDKFYPSPAPSNQSASGTQSPPMQVTGHPAGYDPNRIPSSIFSTKPATPMEWSVASNESLFSIHIGNSSFSRDHLIMINKSGEMPRSDDLMTSPPFPPPVPTLDPNKSKSTDTAAPQENKQRSPRAEEVGHNSPTSYRSDGSNQSINSFHFPYFAGESGKSSPVALDHDTQPQRQQLRQQLQAADPEKIIKPARFGWFSCFCCPRCF